MYKAFVGKRSNKKSSMVCSFRSAVCGLRSAICSLQMSDTASSRVHQLLLITNYHHICILNATLILSWAEDRILADLKDRFSYSRAFPIELFTFVARSIASQQSTSLAFEITRSVPRKTQRDTKSCTQAEV